MIPFLAIIHNIEFINYSMIPIEYQETCKYIIQKCRIRGVKLVLPSDIVICEEEISIVDSMDLSIGVASCDDGFDTEADFKTYHLCDLVLKQVSGYVYDIGKTTIAEMKSDISSADLVLSWGSIGLCECSSFQIGQRALVEMTHQTPFEERKDIKVLDPKKPLQTLLLGNSHVEWYSRIIDSDGEYHGDIVRAGFVALALRQSNSFINVMNFSPCNYLTKDVLSRPRDMDSDWITVKPILDEDEDDDED